MYIALYVFLIFSVMANIAQIMEVAEDNSIGAIATRSSIAWNIFCMLFAVILFVMFAFR